MDTENLSFGNATEKMKLGDKVARKGWNGKGMFIFFICENCWTFATYVSGVDEIDTLPFFCMKTADNKLVPWLASQTDTIAEDWCVVE